MLLSFSFIDNGYVKANALEQNNIENLTESEALEFVTKYNIDLPSGISDSTIGGITRSIILECYNNPNIEFIYNYDEMQEYAYNIKEIVSLLLNDYGVSVASTTNYSLQYNKVKNSSGNWVTSGGTYDTRWQNYNCYAYSINRIEQPHYYNTNWQYQPGDMSGTGSFDNSQSISVLANVVKNDLLAMGYTNVVLYTSIPTLPIGNEELICVRQGQSDYHFMHYDKIENAWLHKPGNTAVLKYNYTPNNSMIWYGEYSFYGSEESNTSLTYDSNIYFIKYNKPLVNISNGNTLSTTLNIQQAKDSILEINNSTNGNISIFLYSGNSISVNLYNDEMDLVNTYTGNNLTFSTTGAHKKYYIRVNFVSSSSSGNISISMSHHSHSYSYTSISSTQHRGSCSCGHSFVGDHIWTQTSGGIILNINELQPNYIVKYVCTVCDYETNKPPIGA